MRICIFGDFSGSLDEGFKNIAFNLSNSLKKDHDVKQINIMRMISLNFWLELKKFKPEIIHIISGPTVKGLIIIKLLKFLFPESITIVSALHSYSIRRLEITKKIMSYFKPDIVLTQSLDSEEMFQNMGCVTRTLYNGVDTERFRPVDQKTKIKLREKYGFDKNKLIFLHVGHLIKARNLTSLIQIQNPQIEVVVVASKHRKWNSKIYKELKENKIRIFEGYFENLEEIYELSDCYIFPVKIGYSLFTPLSVLEAMSCNLPVITTKFEGLMTAFKEKHGLFYIDDQNDLIDKVKEISKKGIKTNEMVLPYSWGSIVSDLENIYATELSVET